MISPTPSAITFVPLVLLVPFVSNIQRTDRAFNEPTADFAHRSRAL